MQTTTETEITEDDVKAMKALDRKKSLAALHENKSLRGQRGGRKTQGILARWFHLNGPDEPPTRVLMMQVRRPAKPKNDLNKQEAAALKRERKNQKRLSDARNGGWGERWYQRVEFSGLGDNIRFVDDLS